MAPKIALWRQKASNFMFPRSPCCRLARCMLHVGRPKRSHLGRFLVDLGIIFHGFWSMCGSFWHNCSWILARIWDVNLQIVEIASNKTPFHEPAKNPPRTSKEPAKNKANKRTPRHTNLRIAIRRTPSTANKCNSQIGTSPNRGAAVSRRMASSIE